MNVDVKQAKMEWAFRTILEELGYDETNPHTESTPERAARAWQEMTSGLEFEFTTFVNKDIDQMVVVQDIPFYSLCAHHLLPFYGQGHIAYIPDKKLVGLSKLPRAIERFAHGLTVQEELTKDITDFLVEQLEPKGCAVVLQGQHLCMAMRGVEKPGHLTTTSSMFGVFLDPGKDARQEFLALIKGGVHG